MKTKLIFLTVLIAAFSAVRAQGPLIPNGNFATWDTIVLAAPDTVFDSTGTIISIDTGQYYLTPADWATIDDVLGAPLGFSYIDMADVAPGATASLELITDTLAGQSAQEGTIVSFASLGTATFLGQGFSYAGMPFIFRPDTLFFDYQYTSAGGTDTAGLSISLMSTDTGVSSSIMSAQSDLYASSAWTTSYIVLTSLYTNAEIPDSLYIQFFSSASQNPVIGATLHIDNVRFRYAHVIHEHASAVGPTTFCSGDSVILSARTDPNFSYYQWYMNDGGTPITGANTPYYTAYNSGAYFVIIDSAGVLGRSDTVNVTVNPLPAPTLIAVQGADTNSFCFPSGVVYLYGGPAGGSYVGTGVTDSNATFMPYETGSFVLSYAYTDSNNCSAIATDTVSVNICTGITEVTREDYLDVYPNPTSNILNVVSDKDLSGCRMQVYDVVGSLVASQVLEGLTNTVNVSMLANGTYIVKVIDAHDAHVSQNKFTVIR